MAKISKELEFARQYADVSSRDFWVAVKRFNRYNERRVAAGLKGIDAKKEASKLFVKGSTFQEKNRIETLKKDSEEIRNILIKNRWGDFVRENPALKEEFNKFLAGDISQDNWQEIVKDYKRQPDYLNKGGS